MRTLSEDFLFAKVSLNEIFKVMSGTKLELSSRDLVHTPLNITVNYPITRRTQNAEKRNKSIESTTGTSKDI